MGSPSISMKLSPKDIKTVIEYFPGTLVPKDMRRYTGSPRSDRFISRIKGI